MSHLPANSGGESQTRAKTPDSGSATGPGWMVAAAFVGPGTVTTATLAGASFGASLLWALLFSTLATLALQEMSARLGVVTGAGLGEAIRGRFVGTMGRVAAVLLVVSAITFGNAAYQTGNILGASLGLGGLFGGSAKLWAVLVGGLAAGLLWTASYRLVERVMVVLVGLMSLTFLGTAVMVRPDLGSMLSGMFVPSLPPGSILVVVGLVGTTVVPYNLFLHASAAAEHWSGEEFLPAARRDLLISITLGGLVSMAILITSAGTLHGSGVEVVNAADMAQQLEPLLGRWAHSFFGLGLFAAGMTSAVTAPLAAAYATAGALGWESDLRSPRMRAVWSLVLLAGLSLALAGVRPVPAILFAQAANGVLLPAVAVFLLLTMNDRNRLGRHVNGWKANLVGAIVLLVAALLGARALLTVAGII